MASEVVGRELEVRLVSGKERSSNESGISNEAETQIFRQKERQRMSTTGKTNSIVLTEGPSRAAARAMLRAVGFSREDLAKPIIGVANTWT